MPTAFSTILTCTRCLLEKPVGEFPTRGGRPRRPCKSCGSGMTKAWRAAHPEHVNATRKAWALTPVGRASQRRTMLRRAYGPTGPETVDRLWVEQAGRCAVCTEPLSAAVGAGTGYHVDHSHTTGMIRGLACPGCNLALGHLKESPSRADAAAAYLRKHGGV